MRKSRLIQTSQARVTEQFNAGTTARATASLVGVCRTVGFCFHRLRAVIAFEREAEGEAMFGGEIEVDERYCGGKRKGKRGCGAARKI